MAEKATVGSLLVSPEDWRRIQDIEQRAHSHLTGVVANAWALRQSVGQDLRRVEALGRGLKGALVAAAVIGLVNTVALVATSRASLDEPEE